MSAAKHTPGPWAVEEVAGCIEVVNEETLFTIARIGLGGGEAARPLVIANARLIAAAPDLLEALKDMNQVLKEAMTTGGWVPTPVQASFRDAWLDMTAAIAKATGEGA